MPILRPKASTLTHEEEAADQASKEGLRSKISKLRGGGRFPWRKRPKDRVWAWLVSPQLQLAAQVAIAQIWASSFTFTRYTADTDAPSAALMPDQIANAPTVGNTEITSRSEESYCLHILSAVWGQRDAIDVCLHC